MNRTVDEDAAVEERLPFGELAVLEEMLTREQLQGLLHAQADRREREDKNVMIGTLLVREGYLTKDQAKRILRIQRRQGPIDGYALIEHLGSGGMGSVFRAIQESTGREVAVKILPPRATHDSRYRARFLREAALLEQLDHEHLVPCYDKGECNGHLFFAMECVPGLTGRALLRRDGAFSEALARTTLAQVLSAMEHYWEARIVHRDIKPENIIYTPDGKARLTDLGLSRQLDDGLHITRVGKTLGTPLYISPELAKGRSDIDVRSDLYSLGATYYHLAAGVPPFVASSQGELLKAHVEEAPVSPRLKNARLSEGFSAILLKLLEKRPEDRFATPGDVLEALARLDRGEAPLPPERPRRKTATGGHASVGRRRPGWSVGSSAAGSSAVRAGYRAPERGFERPRWASVAALVGFAALFSLGVLIGSQSTAPAIAADGARVDQADFERLLVQDPSAAAQAVLGAGAASAPLSAPSQAADATVLSAEIERLSAVAARLPEAHPLSAPVAARLKTCRTRLEELALGAVEDLRSRLIVAVDAQRFAEAEAQLDAFPRLFLEVRQAAEAYTELKRELQVLTGRMAALASPGRTP